MRVTSGMLGLLCLVFIAQPIGADDAVPTEPGELRMQSIDGGRWHFGGEVGNRVEANVAHWLLRTPDANPGLIEMFRRRDRRLPYNTPVPWAGEFAGKYLISAAQACRLTDDDQLQQHTAAFVRQLVESQAEDGYLGPWPHDERLLGHWDLWGHYHCLLGLLEWYDLTGDEKAYDCARRAADCVCDIYVDGDRRPIQAGSPQINLAILHVIGDLYRRTGTQRYLTLMRRIEQDMQADGDWLRLGVKGVPYYKLPGGGTRWESLHIVQGFVELYRITGEERYREAVLNLWKSVRDFDRHPSGAFSTHESAQGTVYDKGAIETCCSIAWEALTIDVLQLTGDSTVADELELTTWNQILGSQHPSGSWWTYDTPMDGVRIPSFHHINFQYRPGTPELNCCSVNAPRGLGMLAEWAVMEQGKDVVVNFYGPGELTMTRAGQKLTLTQQTRFPVDGVVTLKVAPETDGEFAILFRIPQWSKQTTIKVNGQVVTPLPQAGTYFEITRIWQAGDEVQLELDMATRHWAGQGTRHAHAALYRGPLLLAFDAYYNELETSSLPDIDMDHVQLELVPGTTKRAPGHFPPLGLWKCQADNGVSLLLCDFASAGAHGTDYVAWLPAAHAPPPAVRLSLPDDNATGKGGPVLFRWEPLESSGYDVELMIAKDRQFENLVVHRKCMDACYIVIEEGLERDGIYYWKVQTVNRDASTENQGGPRSIRIDSSQNRAFLYLRQDGLMAACDFDGEEASTFGGRDHQQDLRPVKDRTGKMNSAVSFNGQSSELRYQLPFFPAENYSFVAWVCPEGLPTQGLQQVFSAWCKGGDDPLRVTLEGRALFARIENPSGGCSTDGVPLENDRWVHVAAVKAKDQLTLYIDGESTAHVGTHARVHSASRAVGIGFNPLFPPGEHFVGKIDDFALYARALAAEEIAEMSRRR